MAFLKRVGGRVVGETPPVLRTRHRPKGQPFTQGSGAPFDARPRLLEIIVTTLGRKEEGIRASLLSRKATAPCAASSVPRPEWKGHGERCTFVAIVLRLFLSLSRPRRRRFLARGGRRNRPQTLLIAVTNGGRLKPGSVWNLSRNRPQTLLIAVTLPRQPDGIPGILCRNRPQTLLIAVTHRSRLRRLRAQCVAIVLRLFLSLSQFGRGGPHL